MKGCFDVRTYLFLLYFVLPAEFGEGGERDMPDGIPSQGIFQGIPGIP